MSCHPDPAINAEVALDELRRERDEAREHLDDAIELAASAIRAHTRAIHHLAGNCDYPEDEQAATGRWLANALLDCQARRAYRRVARRKASRELCGGTPSCRDGRDVAREALGGGDD